MEGESPKINTPIQDMVSKATTDSTVGPMIASIVIIIIMIVGGLYFFGTLISYKKEQIKAEQFIENQQESTQVEQAAKQSPSDDVTSIETDIKATNIDDLDKGLDQIDKEF
jgi:predicted histidine transporter YuiF (NhaC family)